MAKEPRCVIAALVVLELAAFAHPVAAQVREVSGRTLCGTPAFGVPVPTIERLQTLMSRPSAQRDLAAVLAAAGLSPLVAEAQQILANALVTEAPQPPGTALEWMARRAPQPSITGPLRWSGPGTLDAFGFVIDDLSSAYTFIVPKACGGIALVRREPSLEAARRAEAARAADAARQAEEAVQARLKAAERALAEVRARRDAEMERVNAAAAIEQAKVEADTERALAAQREQERQLVAQALSADSAAAPSTSAETRRELGVFAAPFAGAMRQRSTAVSSPEWTGVAGVKAGVDVPLGRHWSLRPGLGIDTRLDQSKYTRLSFETELAFSLGARVAIGSGLAVVDATRGDRAHLGWLTTIGAPLGSSANRQPLRVLLEGRRLFERAGRQDGDYRVLAGLEVRFR
jgi:cell division septum initiation protein DivIVA